MMKYIFCIMALVIQPIFAWSVYRKQDKRKAALKVPMLAYSGIYLFVQMYVFIKFCIKFPEKYQFYSYLIQGAILVGFIVLELVLWGSNQYIERLEEKEQDSIRSFKSLIEQLEICRVCVDDDKKRARMDQVLARMRYEDPVSSPQVEAENQMIYELIAELPNITEPHTFEKQCDEIVKQLEIRKIKNKKE